MMMMFILHELITTLFIEMNCNGPPLFGSTVKSFFSLCAFSLALIVCKYWPAGGNPRAFGLLVDEAECVARSIQSPPGDFYSDRKRRGDTNQLPSNFSRLKRRRRRWRKCALCGWNVCVCVLYLELFGRRMLSYNFTRQRKRVSLYYGREMEMLRTALLSAWHLNGANLRDCGLHQVLERRFDGWSKHQHNISVCAVYNKTRRYTTNTQRWVGREEEAAVVPFFFACLRARARTTWCLCYDVTWERGGRRGR